MASLIAGRSLDKSPSWCFVSLRNGAIFICHNLLRYKLSWLICYSLRTRDSAYFQEPMCVLFLPILILLFPVIIPEKARNGPIPVFLFLSSLLFCLTRTYCTDNVIEVNRCPVSYLFGLLKVIGGSWDKNPAWCCVRLFFFGVLLSKWDFNEIFLWKWGFVFNHNGKREEIRQGNRFEKPNRLWWIMHVWLL